MRAVDSTTSPSARAHPRGAIRLLVVGLLLVGCSPQAQAYPGGGKRALKCDDVPRLLRLALAKHVRHRQIDDDLEERAADVFLRSLDPSRMLLRESEADSMRLDALRLFDEARAGRCDGIRSVNDRIVKRLGELTKFVAKELDRKNYKVDRTTKLIVDPDRRGFPKSVRAQHTLWRKYIHFQMANYLDGDTPMKEAKRLLEHRYELMTKRAADVDQVDLYGMVIDAFAGALDPHTDYLSADDLEDFDIMMRLSLEGIGAELSSRDGYVTVERLVPGGAAARHGGLDAGDKIIAVAQKGGEPTNVIDMPLRDVVRLIRGKAGSPVRLSLMRSGEKTKRKTITIVRERIKLEEQAAQLSLEGVKRGKRDIRLGVLELPSFYGDTRARGTGRRSLADVHELLKEAKAAKVDGLLLDLSRNGGGLLDEAVAISGLFLRAGGVVAVRETGDDPQVLEDPDPRLVFDKPLVVLISRVSASGAEILAGALQDYGRAVIVGDRQTFGKGSVQTVISLPPGLGALKVTVALFFLPGGASTQASGVQSDIVVPSLTDSSEIGESSLPNALPSQRVDRFVSRRGNGPTGGNRYRPVSTSLLSDLKRLSVLRTRTNTELVEIAEKRTKMEARAGVVDLSEHEEEAANGNGSRDDDEPAGLTAQQKEALEVLADLVIASP